jgi:hypothetical protein
MVFKIIGIDMRPSKCLTYELCVVEFSVEH